jgi:hypothetical protein
LTLSPGVLVRGALNKTLLTGRAGTCVVARKAHIIPPPEHHQNRTNTIHPCRGRHRLLIALPSCHRHCPKPSTMTASDRINHFFLALCALLVSYGCFDNTNTQSEWHVQTNIQHHVVPSSRHSTPQHRVSWRNVLSSLLFACILILIYLPAAHARSVVSVRHPSHSGN